uniref:Phosphodiesterase n=1 Tax=Panagrellus redivivus TaxID=6233 RepID=A0A7E4W608_PANRE
MALFDALWTDTSKRSVFMARGTPQRSKPMSRMERDSRSSSRGSNHTRQSSAGPPEPLLNGDSQVSEDSILSRRKVSLMPLVTEEDLRDTDLGRKDPEGIAQVFGDDVASRFRYPSTPTSLMSPPPYDTKEKMLRRKISPIGPPPLAFETRDDSLPRGVPTVKVRVRKENHSEASTSNAFEDVSVALSPVLTSKYSFSMANHGKNFSFGHKTFSNTFELDYESFAAEIAASNPDMVHFQQVLNQWIKGQSKAQGTAFILLSSEWVSCFCQVAGDKLLKDPIVCGDSSLLYSLISNAQVASDDGTQSNTGSTDGATPPIVIDTESLSPLLRAKLRVIATELGADISPDVTLPPCSLVLIQARSDFKTALFIVHRSKVSTANELACVMPHVQMIGTLMSIVANIEEQKRLARQSQIFLSMTQNVFSSLQDMNLLVRNITKEAKALVQAEICSLFLLDKEHSELVAEVFEKNGTTDEYLTEIRMPLTQGIVGHVATTGEMMNVKDVYNHPFFYPKVDERTGFVTRNILCFPIKDSSGNLVGVAELCNKIGKPAFTPHDEQIATTFAVYCAISISHCLLYRKLQEAHRRSHMAAELLVQGSTLSIAPEDILRLTVRDIPDPTSFHPDFTKFCFVPRSVGTGDTFVEASLSMFKDLGFIEKYRLRRRTLARFLLMVQKGYRDVPYHNWSHAFAVGHFCYLLLRMPDVKNALTDLERFSLLVACLCHDIDHRGTTNAFQLQSKTPLAQLYSSEGSVLERHHFAQTVTILGMDECNIFEQLTRQQYQQVLDNIREIILATDIAAHLRKVDRIKHMAETGFNRNNQEHHYLMMCLLMTASDLSDQSKDFKNSKGIAENIYKEFFSQGDLEKQMGNRPIEMMDRERACVPKIQLEFMDTVALPVFRHLSVLLPDLSETYDSLEMNRTCWQTLDSVLQEQGLPSGGLDYLKDLNLEKTVLDRVGEKLKEKLNEAALSKRAICAANSTDLGSPTIPSS